MPERPLTLKAGFRTAWSPLAGSQRVLATTLRNLAAQDVAVLVLDIILAWKVLAVASSRVEVRVEILLLLMAAAVMLLITRGELLASGPLRAAAYRVGSFSAMIGSYLLLRPLLPELHPRLLDLQLLAIDDRLFGVTPALWLDRFVTPRRVEWFAFFYYSYYALLGSALIGSLLFDDGRRRNELLLGAAIIACVGHSGYTFVPGLGPFRCDQIHFTHALVGGPWWDRVQTAVSSAGAQLDIFPSLHTGFSLLVAQHAFRHRKAPVYAWTWLPIWFCVANIVIATVFLRWHYGIDLIAGATLSIASYRLAVFLAGREAARSVSDDRQPVFEPILPAFLPASDRRLFVGVLVLQLFAVVMLLQG
jgi:membrane-associated phospholipid phosphatase